MRPPDDKYEDVEFVAEGGMARVYRARHRDTGRIVAVREISGGPGSEDRIASEERGAEIQRALCAIDARVPKVFDIFKSPNGWLYVEMEYVDGEDLATILQRGPMPIADSLRVAIALFDFLRVAHSTAVSVDGEQRNQQVHGDLTPKNIRIASSGGVRILDFGIAKGLKTTVTAVSFANYGYVSPERARSGQMGISDDFWSAGVVLYEMLSGRRAFPGTLEEISATLADRRAPSALDEKIPRPLRLIVQKLLAWDPAYRYPDANAVLADFDAFLRHQRTRAEAEADASRTRAVTEESSPRVAASGASGSPAPTASAAASTSGGRTTSAAAQTTPVAHSAKTTPIRVPPLPKPPAPDGGRRTKPPQAPRKKGSGRWMLAAMAAVFIVVQLHERSIWRDAEARRRLAVFENADLDSLWTDYHALTERAWLSSTTERLADMLAEKLISEATTTLKQFREDTPRIRERQIETARGHLARALVVDPGNEPAEAWLRYAQGHLERIEGEAARGDERRELWGRAVVHFEEAAQLARDLPDPYIALTRLYSHRDYRDPDRARRAMAAAEQRGHTRGLREHAQLGDLSRDEGDVLYRQARDLRGTTSEEPLLVRARAELATALAEYEQSRGFGQSNERIREINQALRRLDARLAEIKVPAPEEPAAPAPDLQTAQAAPPEPPPPPAEPLEPSQ
jgi:serine/threonine-protein kinase